MEQTTTLLRQINAARERDGGGGRNPVQCECAIISTPKTNLHTLEQFGPTMTACEQHRFADMFTIKFALRLIYGVKTSDRAGEVPRVDT